MERVSLTQRFAHYRFIDAEDIFADADSIDAVPPRPGIAYMNVDADSIDSTSRQPGFMNAIQISDDEMDAVCVLFDLCCLQHTFL